MRDFNPEIDFSWAAPGPGGDLQQTLCMHLQRYSGQKMGGEGAKEGN